MMIERSRMRLEGEYLPHPILALENLDWEDGGKI